MILSITQFEPQKTLYEERDEWRLKCEQFKMLLQGARREEDDDSMAGFEDAYRLAAARYEAACQALDLSI